MNTFRILCFWHNLGYTTLRNNNTYWAADHPHDHSDPPDLGASLDYMLNEWKTRDQEWIKIYSIYNMTDGVTYSIGDRIRSLGQVVSIQGFDVSEPWAGGFGINHIGQTVAVEYVTKYPIEYPNV